MKKFALAFVLIVSALLLYSLTGCGSGDNKVVAKVDDYNVTADELNMMFARVRTPFASAQEEFDSRRMLLDTIIVTRILIDEAYKKNIDKLDEIARVVLDSRDKFLLDALYKKHIASKSEPTDAEVKEFYDNLEFKFRVTHILVGSLEEANQMLEFLKEGRSFDELAYEYSIDPSAKRNKGDLGYFTWGAMVDEFQQAVIQMEPGEISPPVKSDYGYHIIKMIDKLPNESRTDFASMKESITNKVREYKTREVSKAYFQSLKDKYPVTVEKSTCDYLLHKRETLYPPQILKTLPRNDFDLEVLDRDEKDLVLATMDGSQMTINEYFTQLKNVPQRFRPDLDNYDSLATIVFEMKKMDILALEAVREGLDNEDEFQKNMKLFKELNMAEIMRNDSIPPPPAPDENTIRQYYEEHLDQFTTPAKVHVFEIQLSDELQAKKLQKSIKSLSDFKSKAQDLTERHGFRTKSGDLNYFTRNVYPEIFDAAMETPVGEIGGPVLNNQKHSIFYVVDKLDPETKAFLGVKRSIVDKLNNDQKSDTFAKWVEEKKKEYNISINEDALWSTVDMSRYNTEQSES